MNYLDKFKPEKINSIPAIRQSLKILKDAIDGREIGNYPPEGGVKFEDLTEELQHSLPKYIETTYSELKSLRDNSQLIPGCWYRITDYECTTTQENTKSAGHKFDILVLATSVNTLSEEAKAIQSERDKELKSIYSDSLVENFIRCSEADGDFDGEHYYAFIEEKDKLIYIYTKSLTEIPKGDNFFVFETDDASWVEIKNAMYIATFADYGETIASYTGLYFANCNLNAWKIWYSLDNDSSRFAWANNGEYPTYISTPDILDGEHLEFQGITYINGSPELNYGTSEQSIRYAGGDERNAGGFVFRDVANNTSLVGKSIDYIRLAVANDETFIIVLFNKEFDESFNIHSENISEESIADKGKGVIYRMIDEWNNDCPYDFKNILICCGGGLETSNKFLYLFSYIDADNNIIDDTVHPEFTSMGKSSSLNVIKSLNGDGSLNYIFFINYGDDSINTGNTIGYYSNNVYLLGGCLYNVIGDNCDEIGLYKSHFNVIENGCTTIGYNNVEYNSSGRFTYCHFAKNVYEISVDIETTHSDIHFLSGVGPVDLQNVRINDHDWVGLTSNDDIRIWNPADPSGT